jgi:hypothetical protein
MIWFSLNLLFFTSASWCHTHPETSTFQWSGFQGYLQHAPQLREVYLGPVTPQNLLAQTQIGINILSSFLEAADLSEEGMAQVAYETERAINRLQEAGLIQDPLKKWVRNLLLSTTLLIPVN